MEVKHSTWRFKKKENGLIDYTTHPDKRFENINTKKKSLAAINLRKIATWFAYRKSSHDPD